MSLMSFRETREKMKKQEETIQNVSFIIDVEIISTDIKNKKKLRLRKAYIILMFIQKRWNNISSRSSMSFFFLIEYNQCIV